MATAATIKKNIAKLEAALKSKATPKSLKSKLETQLVKSKAELSGLNKGTKPKTSSTKSTQSALKNLKELVNKNKKYKNYKGAGVDLERDADRPAKPIGRRTAKASGKTYYEYRANRIDVKQPPKRYPKLEKGGYMADGGEMPLVWKRKYGFSLGQKVIINGEVDEVVGFVTSDDEENYNMGYRLILKENGTQSLGSVEKYEKGGYYAKGGSLSSIKEEYDENEDNNAHSENVVLLAKHFGTKEDLVEAKRILDLHEKEGHLTSENGKKRQELHLKLIEKARTAMDKEGIEFAKGGYMADGGKVYMLGEEEVYIKDSSIGLDDEVCLHYKKDDSILKCISKNSFDIYVEQGKLKPKLEKGGYYAKGGAMEHGLKRGDTIIDDMSWDNSVKVLNNKTGYAVVHLETGERKEMKAMGGEMHRTQE